MRSADREPFKGFPRVPVRFDTGALHGLYTRGAFGVGLPGSKLVRPVGLLSVQEDPRNAKGAASR